jgi:hypothetical protein
MHFYAYFMFVDKTLHKKLRTGYQQAAYNQSHTSEMGPDMKFSTLDFLLSLST